jgi:hypothetical protein
VKSLCLALVLLMSTVLAQGWTLQGKARLYPGGAAEVYAMMVGKERGEMRVGTIDADGQFHLELPEALPVTPTAPGDSCDLVATSGLEIAAIAQLEVRRGAIVLGELSFASQPRSASAVGWGETGDEGRYGFLFHANQSGSLRQNCVTDQEQQISDVDFQPGWNWVTARVARRNDKPVLYLSSGAKAGLMRWWFVAAALKE